MDWQQIRQRLLSKTNSSGDGCWDWTGSLDWSGYARVAFRGRNCRASRVAWSAFNEREWPDGKHALHSCDNRRCVNPAHIRPGTNAENVADKCAKGRHQNQRVTHCPKGHEYTPENTYRHRGRQCKTCVNARATAFAPIYRARKERAKLEGAAK